MRHCCLYAQVVRTAVVPGIYFWRYRVALGSPSFIGANPPIGGGGAPNAPMQRTYRTCGAGGKAVEVFGRLVANRRDVWTAGGKAVEVFGRLVVNPSRRWVRRLDVVQKRGGIYLG